MKKSILTLFFCIGIFTISFAQNTSLNSIREDLFYSTFDLKKSVQFYESCSNVLERTPIIQAYTAAAEALIAKHSWNPIQKFSHLDRAVDALEEAIELDQKNLEIRFLRLYIQRSIPSYLGMSKNMDEDKKMLLDHIETLQHMELDPNVYAYIINYMTSPDVVSSSEVQVIKAKLQLP